MPHLRVRGMNEEEVKLISSEIALKLAVLTNMPQNVFGIELINTKYFEDGKELKATTPLFEVLWFDRGQGIQDKAAEIITSVISPLGYEDIRVSFINMVKSQYYKNGTHY